MRGKGINYDTGFVSGGTTTHEPFDPNRVRREMEIIRQDLHCSAVRITGGCPERLEIAAAHAAAAGLEVWFCPFTNNLTDDELLDVLADCAERAERVRLAGAEVVFLTGSELSLMNRGFLPGDQLADRMALLAQDPQAVRPLIQGLRPRVNELLRKAVDTVRARFGGKVSYASVPLDGVNWTPFDIISTDAGYRSAAMAARFRDDIRAFVAQGRAQGKPVAVTEFGCASYRGAASLADRGEILVWGDDARPVGFKGQYTRDEEEQARYVVESLEVYDTEGVDYAFVYTFARYDMAGDFDLASAGVVKVLEGFGQRYPDMPWEPKTAFTAVAEFYGRTSDVREVGGGRTGDPFHADVSR